MERLGELNTQPGKEWSGQLSNAISLFGDENKATFNLRVGLCVLLQKVQRFWFHLSLIWT